MALLCFKLCVVAIKMLVLCYNRNVATPQCSGMWCCGNGRSKKLGGDDNAIFFTAIFDGQHYIFIILLGSIHPIFFQLCPVWICTHGFIYLIVESLSPTHLVREYTHSFINLLVESLPPIHLVREHINILVESLPPTHLVRKHPRPHQYISGVSPTNPSGERAPIFS